MNPELMRRFTTDKIRAVDAKFEAQKLAFAPYAFQAARSMRKFGILAFLEEKGDQGALLSELLDHTKLSQYALTVLLEMGLSMDVVKLVPHVEPWRYRLGKVGFFLINDKLTTANMDFIHDVCYEGAFTLDESLEKGSPEGLKVFGGWKTVYQGLSSLPEQVKKSWFTFDHYYSDCAFPSALEIVFKTGSKKIMDIGGNTAKWAMACTAYDKDVQVTIVDLPGQAAVARANADKSPHGNRIAIAETDMLDPASILPPGHDTVWMSQFLDCFSLDEVRMILKKIHGVVDADANIFVMEPLWDVQKYPAATYSLHGTSLYFTNIANGNSKMYSSAELKEAIESVGFTCVELVNEVGPNDYSIFRFKKNT